MRFLKSYPSEKGHYWVQRDGSEEEEEIGYIYKMRGCWQISLTRSYPPKTLKAFLLEGGKVGDLINGGHK